MSKTRMDMATLLKDYDAFLFDLDGVLTATARVHATCWKRMFDEYLEDRAERLGKPFRPFDIAEDYEVYVDGKPRLDGIRSFLASRGIQIPDGDRSSPPESETVNGLGKRKNAMVKEVIASGAVDVFEGSVDFLRRLHEKGAKTAVVSSSKNCQAVLEAVGLEDEFDERVDGVVAASLKLPGKPKPDTFLKASELLGVSPERSVVIEDAISGVQAGRNGRFGLVIGVDRKGNPEPLRENGADIVVGDLSELNG